ncbi:hypothetical protein CDL12_17224 [Handroanthus impetiginosus]|uniref:Uncharacterized protein n=1 Tax=Handroanthus impetiginosus TaxID=429701 RepID=A0A2G9GYV5_9LAMI|nr:hypothetical protein CDL12_17224 [Handroanthus impetiginosus]
MASLKNGVLLKLLEEMKMDENALEDDPKPVLLQIRSIIPVLEEGDLWPNRGFFLKVSDLSHALYVSLSEEQNEMILGNKLKLGQFIYVQKLEKADPVPLLTGVTTVPGRRSCEGTPEDIVSPGNFVKLLEASSVDSVVEKGVILEKKISKSPSISRKSNRGLSDSESCVKRNEGLKGGYQGRCRSLSASKARPGEKCAFRKEDFERTCYNDVRGRPRSRPSSVDNDSDVDSVISSVSSTRISKRRSWNESEIMGVKEIFDSSVKDEIRLPPRHLSANVSPVRSVRYDSSDDNSGSTSRRRVAASAKRIIKSSNKSRVPEPTKVVNNMQIPNSLCSLVYDRKGAETGILWDSLPSNLVKFGKEVVRQRDVALLAAADALQEACASERLLNSLSTLSQFPLAEGDDLQPYVDKFFDLQADLAHTRLIMQSLTSISPFRNEETEPCITKSVKETLAIALERKKNAMTWIRSAVALDLSPCASPLDLSTNPVDPTNTVKKTTPSSHSSKPKGTSIVKRTRSNADIPLILALDKEDQAERTRGSTLSAAFDLATYLQDECRKLFLNYVEKYLDEVDQKTSSMESDGEMAGMMYKVKMVSDWLDMIVSKEGNFPEGRAGCDNLDESEAEAYGRVRNKIYGILLRHVERTAMAFDRLNTSM